MTRGKWQPALMSGRAHFNRVALRTLCPFASVFLSIIKTLQRHLIGRYRTCGVASSRLSWLYERHVLTFLVICFGFCPRLDPEAPAKHCTTSLLDCPELAFILSHLYCFVIAEGFSAAFCWVRFDILLDRTWPFAKELCFIASLIRGRNGPRASLCLTLAGRANREMN